MNNLLSSEAPTGLKNPFFTTLVVDDKLSFEGFLEEFFKSEQHFVLRAENAEEAMSATRKFQPDLILLSNQMDSVSPLALLPELLMEQTSAAVIMMAKKPSVAEAVAAMKLGAADYLPRPLDPRRLKQDIDDQKALFHI